MATDLKVFEPYIDGVVREVTGDDIVHRDADGEIPFRLDHAIAYVQLIQGPMTDPLVRIYSVLRREVAPSAEFFAALNGLNCSSAFLKFIWQNGALIVDTEMRVASLKAEDVILAMHGIDHFASQLDSMIGVHGVSTAPTEAATDVADVPSISGETAGPGIDASGTADMVRGASVMAGYL